MEGVEKTGKVYRFFFKICLSSFFFVNNSTFSLQRRFRRFFVMWSLRQDPLDRERVVPQAALIILHMVFVREIIVQVIENSDI